MCAAIIRSAESKSAEAWRRSRPQPPAAAGRTGLETLRYGLPFLPVVAVYGPTTL